MKLLVDMNLSPGWAGYLTRNGIEAEHWSSIGSPNASDSEIMAYAKAHDYAVLTNDLDFGFILAITQNKKPSVVQIRTGILGLNIIGDTVMNAIRRLADEIENGALVTIDQRKIRVTLLPL